MSKQPKRNQLIIERTCWVWAVSYKRSSGVFNTWNIYGSEEKAKQAEASGAMETRVLRNDE